MGYIVSKWFPYDRFIVSIFPKYACGACNLQINFLYSIIFGSNVSKILAIDPKMMTIDPKMMIDLNMMTIDPNMMMIDLNMITIDPNMITIDTNMMTIDPT